MFEPTIIYKKGGPHKGPYKSTYSYKGVKTKEEFDLLAKEGWYDNLDEAVNPEKEILRTQGGKGDKFLLGRVKVKRKEDFKEKPKTKAKAKPKTMKEKTKDTIKANEEK